MRRDLVSIGLLTGLFLLCCLGLVRAPEEDKPPLPETSPHMVCALLSAGERETESARRDTTDENRLFRKTESGTPVHLPAIAGDRNGLPLQGLSWVQAAYAACPPEGRFG